MPSPTLQARQIKVNVFAVFGKVLDAGGWWFGGGAHDVPLDTVYTHR